MKDVSHTWATGACFWPAIMTLNFRFVPLSHRPLVGSLAGSFWSVYMALQANKAAGASALSIERRSPSCHTLYTTDCTLCIADSTSHVPRYVPLAAQPL